MVVIYAEKPDMAEKIASVLGGNTFRSSDKKQGFYNIKIKNVDYCVTWGYGHLCTLSDAYEYDESYKNWEKMPIPFIPDDYKIILNTKSPMPVKATASVVRKLFSSCEYIINATDSDREGELIFYYIYTYLRCRKPVKRILLESTTKNGITEAFNNMIDSKEQYNLLQSARCRSIADWVVGCNMTAAMTVQCGGGSIYSVGRVQTPTLAMVVSRDEEIENFKSSDYYTLSSTFTTQSNEKYKGVHKTKRFDNKSEAEAILNKCIGHDGVVTQIEKTKRLKQVPHLYSLNALQMDANSKYGYTLKRTLDITQQLYEKGFVTYPRTDSQYLPEDMVDKIKETQNVLKNNGYAKFFNNDASVSNMLQNKKQFFDNSKIGSHYAIVTTEVPAKGLNPFEQKIYDLIAFSVIRMLYKPAEMSSTKMTTEVNGEPFITTGNSIISPGWLFVNGDSKEELIPDLQKGDVCDSNCILEAKKTEPPKHFTDKTLLAAMMSAGKYLEDDELKKFMADNKIDGLGTDATRASIEERLLTIGLLERNGKNIISTKKGRELIHTIPVEEIKSASLTAQYEKRLNQIANGNDDPDMFLDNIYSALNDWCDKIKQMPKKEVKRFMNDSAEISVLCPKCGNPLIKYKWGYGCSGYQDGCKFSVGTICGKTLTESQLKKLVENGSVGPIKGFESKAGKKFDASLKLEKDGDDYKISFEFPKGKQDEKKDIYAKCPKCGKTIVKSSWGWKCPDNCDGVSVPYTLCERDIEESTAEALFSYKETDMLEGFISKKGKPFAARLVFNEDENGKYKLSFVFPERNKN